MKEKEPPDISANAVAKLLIFIPRGEQQMTTDGQKLQRNKQKGVAWDEAELELLEILALASRMKFASRVMRSLIYRGLEQYLKDRKLKPSKPEVEILRDVLRMVDDDPSLSHIREAVRPEQPKRVRKTAS